MRLSQEASALAKTDPRQALTRFDQLIVLNRQRARSGSSSAVGDLAENFLWKGILHFQVDHLAEAEGDFRESMRFSLSCGHRAYQAQALNHLGVVYRDLGKYEQALESYEQARELLLLVPDPPYDLDFQVLRNLAGLHRILNNDAQADNFLELAGRLADLEGGSVDGDKILLDRAWARQVANDHHGALELYWAIFERWEQLPGEDRILLFDRLASLLADLGRRPEALLASGQALKLARQFGRWRDEIRLSVNRCRLASEFAGQETEVQEAAAFCAEAEKLIEKNRDTNLISLFKHVKAGRLRHEGKLAEAIAAAGEAADMADSLRFLVPGRNGRSRFLESRSYIFRRQVDLLMQAHREYPAAGHDLQALGVSERLKARTLLDLWSIAEVDFWSKVPAAERHDLKTKLDELDALALNRRNPATDTRIDVLLADLDALEDRLLHLGPTTGWLPPATFSLAGVQAKLDPETAIVLLLYGEKKSYLFLIGDQGPVRSSELEPSKVLEAAANRFQLSLADRRFAFFPPATEEAGRELARLLWGDHEERLAGLPERLIFVGDGSLQRVALYPLPHLDRKPGSPRHLIDSHELVYLPSLTLLDQWAAREKSVGRPTRNAIVFGDPLYRLSEHPPETVAELGRLELKDHFPEGPDGLRLGRLPFADLEAKNIRARFEPLSIEVELGPRASKAAAMAAEIGTYSIVHFASHGWQDPLHDELSALLLSEIDEKGRAADGHLRLQDLYRVAPWRADLVVASACQTGVGDNLRLEGVGGVAQGFVQAGARRVLISLWAVDTEATAILMDHFYEHLLGGMPAGAALREASQDLRRLAKVKQKPWDSPYYWSPFILVGDWSSFVLPEPGRSAEQLPASRVNPIQ